MSSRAESLVLGASLDQAEVDRLQRPVFTKQELSAGDEKFLVITRDYGSGLELREAYVYRQTAERWDMLAYRKTNSSLVVGSFTGRQLKLVSKSGRVLLEVAVEPESFRFDPKEH